ncbi:MAG: phasin family protein [Hyphomicrobiaceae bacterium]
MADLPQFEIPEAMRDMAERNVEQARSAYGQFLEMARQAQDVVAKSSDTMAQSARDIQLKAMRYAEQNMEANFAFVGDLAKARDLRDYMEIQSRHAQRQMQTYSEQAQELGRMLSDVAQKVQRRV